MSSSSVIVQRVDAVLSHALEHERSKWTAVDSDLAVVFDEISSLATSGKRLRPQFAHWGWVAAGGDAQAETPDSIGAAIELLHIFALFHDDVIDDAGTRRGKATTHVRLSQNHAAHEWAGESRRFGEGSAVLIGDIVYVMSDQLMNSLSVSARTLWSELRMEMNIGQYLDTVVSASRDTSLEKAERVSTYKTAKYTIERPLHIGAVAANEKRGTELMGMFTAYGIPLGNAFQLRDDLLGAFGDAAVTGKPVGGDFLEGKRTPLLALAFENATASQRDILNTVGTSTVNVERVQEVVMHSGAVQELERRIALLRSQAVDALQESALAGNAYAELIALADAVTQRQF